MVWVWHSKLIYHWWDRLKSEATEWLVHSWWHRINKLCCMVRVYTRCKWCLTISLIFLVCCCCFCWVFFFLVLFNIPQIIHFVYLFWLFVCLFVPLVGPSSYTLHTALGWTALPHHLLPLSWKLQVKVDALFISIIVKNWDTSYKTPRYQKK